MFVFSTKFSLILGIAFTNVVFWKSAVLYSLYYTSLEMSLQNHALGRSMKVVLLY